MPNTLFSKKIIAWYNQHQRNLPWRQTTDAYTIWLSEIILQQTRVAQGLPYFLKFIEAFPTVESLAKAKEEKVLRLWQGLGYYTRARNLHTCAKQIVSEYKSKFPNNYADLIKEQKCFWSTNKIEFNSKENSVQYIETYNPSILS